jgi:hypothetical protein
MELSNGAPVHVPTASTGAAGLGISLTKPQWLALVAGGSLVASTPSRTPGVLARLLGLTDQAEPSFPVVTPKRLRHRGGRRHDDQGPSSRMHCPFSDAGKPGLPHQPNKLLHTLLGHPVGGTATSPRSDESLGQ